MLDIAIVAARAAPAITEAGIVLDLFELHVERAEFISDAPNRRPHIRAIAVFATAGDKSGMMNAIVDRAIGYILVAARQQQIDDAEFGYREIDVIAVPKGPAHIRAQQQLAATERLVTLLRCQPFAHLHDEAQALCENGDAPRLVDKIDGAVIERGVLVSGGRNPGQENDGEIDPALVQGGQQIDAKPCLQLPIENDDVGLGALPLVERLEHRLAAGAGEDIEAEMLELSRRRLAVVVIIVDEKSGETPPLLDLTFGKIERRTRRHILGYA